MFIFKMIVFSFGFIVLIFSNGLKVEASSQSLIISEVNIYGSTGGNCKTNDISANRCGFDKWVELKNISNSSINLEKYSLRIKNSPKKLNNLNLPNFSLEKNQNYLIGYKEKTYQSNLNISPDLVSGKIKNISNKKDGLRLKLLFNNKAIQTVNWNNSLANSTIKKSIEYSPQGWKWSSSTYSLLNYGTPKNSYITKPEVVKTVLPVSPPIRKIVPKALNTVKPIAVPKVLSSPLLPKLESKAIANQPKSIVLKDTVSKNSDTSSVIKIDPVKASPLTAKKIPKLSPVVANPKILIVNKIKPAKQTQIQSRGYSNEVIPSTVIAKTTTATKSLEIQSTFSPNFQNLTITSKNIENIFMNKTALVNIVEENAQDGKAIKKTSVENYFQNDLYNQVIILNLISLSAIFKTKRVRSYTKHLSKIYFNMKKIPISR